MILVGESYPFLRGNFYMTIIDEEMDYIREFATDINGMRYSMHWISEAHRNSCLENTHAQPSRITCPLVRKKSFETTRSSSQVPE
ncbi:hypothetical protein CRYUN_Cryun07bG0021300 [Craigia yunnanensis]